MEKTFVMLKPGILERGIVGEILSRIERKGLSIEMMKTLTIPESQCQEHYQEHREKPFFNDLVAYMTSGPVVAMVIRGEGAIARMRQLCGATRIEDAAAGSIRGDYALDTQHNVIHASDSPTSAQREISLFFTI